MRHLACIMDGNRRWAKSNKLTILHGHQKGAEAIKRVVEFCLKQQITFLSLYTFSLENFNRSPQECFYLFQLISDEAKKYIATFLNYNIRVRFIGARSLFPPITRNAIEELEERTQECQDLSLNFLFCYGSRQEMVDAVKTLVHQAREGTLTEEQVTDERLARSLWTKEIPDPDLIIRTGGATRLSNFLLYQAAYSEFYFTDCYWPDISHNHLYQALDYFKDCKRNFGS